MTAYHVAIRTKSGDPYQWWGQAYDDEAEARQVHADNQQAYQQAARVGSHEFVSDMGAFDTYDVARFELWRIVDQVEAVEPDDLYEEDGE
jgi:hypothetical protein